MSNELKKIELGCGLTKTEGYVGVDRFPLPGVDVVADLNGVFPFKDDSADVIYACHSLEHLDDIGHTMEEIYRICKHGATVQILSPYYMTSMNFANYFHKSVFNEDTMRLFSSNTTKMIQEEQYSCPHAKPWGVEHSDNSDGQVEMEILKMEYFYYKEYCGLSDEEKLYARRSLLNVCDQIFYVLVVNKSGQAFTKIELEEFLNKAENMEPPLIPDLRARDAMNAQLGSKSLYTNVIDKLNDMDRKYNELAGNINALNNKIQVLECECEISRNKYEEIRQKYEHVDNKVEKLIKDTFAFINRKVGKAAERVEGEQIQDKEFVKRLDGLLGEKYELTYSPKIPNELYHEYPVEGDGDFLYVYGYGNIGAKVLIEFVMDGKIVRQDIVDIEGEGRIRIDCRNLRGLRIVRFRALTEESYIKLLQVNRGVARKKASLAYYFS